MCEAYHSLLSHIEVKNGGAEPSLSDISSWCRGAYLIKYRDNFTSLLQRYELYFKNQKEILVRLSSRLLSKNGKIIKGYTVS
jgi:hypothetical protein